MTTGGQNYAAFVTTPIQLTIHPDQLYIYIHTHTCCAADKIAAITSFHQIYPTGKDKITDNS